MADRHNHWREGAITGIIGATALAVWFLIVDLIAGQPFYTPTILGRGLFSVLGSTAGDPDMLHLIVYTVFHYGVFILLGILAVMAVHRSERQPAILALLLVGFVVLEMAFYFYTAILASAGVLPDDLEWYHVAIGNLLAALSAGTYLVRLHPGLGRNFARALTDEHST